MLDLVKSNDTPRVYEKKYIMVDGKFQETIVDITPIHEPTRRLILVGLKERMLEATRNIAATEIQRVIRGISGRTFARNVVPQTNACHIQRCWRGKMGRIKALRRGVAVQRFRGALGLQNAIRSFLARKSFQSSLCSTMPFSNGQWNVCWGALRIQRQSVEDYQDDPNNLVACFRASLFYHTLSTPINCEFAATGYLKVLEGHAGHNASLHFCIGVLLLSGHSMPGYIKYESGCFGIDTRFNAIDESAAPTVNSSTMAKKKKQPGFAEKQEEWNKSQAKILQHAHEHVRKGYEMDPGGRRFFLVEQAYFERAAKIHSEDIEAQLSYGILLLEVRRNATKALKYLRRARLLSSQMENRHKKDLRRFEEDELRAPSVERRRHMSERSNQVQETCARVKFVVQRSIESIDSMEKLWIPVQALWRGHWARCRCGLSIKAAIAQVHQNRLPGDARRTLRLALSFHCILLNYELADGMYRKAMKIDPKDPCILYAYAVLLAALIALRRGDLQSSGETEKLARKRKHANNIREIESLIERARSLDGDNKSYQWMESEFFLPATHRAWDPTIASVYRQTSRISSSIGGLESGATLVSPSRNPLSPIKALNTSKQNSVLSKNSARCACNYALFLQWVQNSIGDANKWFTDSLSSSPGDSMVNGCYEDFFNRGMAFTLTEGEVLTANALHTRLLGRRKVRKEREDRLHRLEIERVKRITVQEMEKERQIRQDALDRIVEDRRRQEMLKHDLRLMGRLRNIQNQRKSILGSIGKSQAEIAAERKRAREEAKKKKRRKEKKNNHKEKKKKKKKA